MAGTTAGATSAGDGAASAGEGAASPGEAAPFRLRTADGLRLAGDWFGAEAARPVILLHGGGQTRHAWSGTAQALAAGGYRALGMDLRGHGDSDWSPAGEYALQDFARDLGEVLAAVGRPAVVVGASLGGLTALTAHRDLPAGALAAVVLVDIAPRMDPGGVARIIGFMQAAPEGFASLEEAADAIAGYLPHRPRPTDLSGLAKNLRQGPDGRWRWHWDPRFLSKERYVEPNVLVERLEQAARALTVPTLLVRGRQSDVLTEESAHDFLRQVPHAEYVDVTDASHMVAGDKNDRFTEAVVGFLGRMAPSTG